MAALIEKSPHTISYSYIWTSCVLFLSSESKILHSPGTWFLFICELQLTDAPAPPELIFLAEQTTKGNSTTTVIYRLTGYNILATFSPSLRGKEKGVSSPQRPLATNAETTSAKLPIFAFAFWGLL